MTFTVKKKLDLSFLGDGWTTGTYINFSSMTFAETRDFVKLSAARTTPQESTTDGATDTTTPVATPETLDNLETVLNLVKSHFLDGMGFNGASVVPLSVDDLESLPTEVITKAVGILAGTPDPKS